MWFSRNYCKVLQFSREIKKFSHNFFFFAIFSCSVFFFTKRRKKIREKIAKKCDSNVKKSNFCEEVEKLCQFIRKVCETFCFFRKTFVLFFESLHEGFFFATLSKALHEMFVKLCEKVAKKSQDYVIISHRNFFFREEFLAKKRNFTKLHIFSRSFLKLYEVLYKYVIFTTRS